MAVSYAFACGSVRARESGLLTAQERETLLALRTPEQLTAALRDRGWGDAAGLAEGEELLRQENARLWDYLRGVTPDFSLYDAFLVRQDYHNLKATIKGVLSGRAYAHLLLEPATVSADLLREAVETRKVSLLPEGMAQAAEKAYDRLAHAADPQGCDSLLDRAAMAAQRQAAQASRVALLCEYIDIQIFYQDARIALRAARCGKDTAFLKEALCDPDPELIRAASAGEDEVLGWLERTDRWGSRQAAELYRKSPSQFEKFAEDQAMACIRRGRQATLGPEPLLGYLAARETEIRTMRLLYSGLRAGRSEADIRERMRELYG